MKTFLSILFLCFICCSLLFFFSTPCWASGESECIQLLRIEKSSTDKQHLLLNLAHIQSIIGDLNVDNGVADIEFTDAYGNVLARLGKIKGTSIDWNCKIIDNQSLLVKFNKEEYNTIIQKLTGNPARPGLRIQVSIFIKKMSKDQTYMLPTKYDENRELLSSCDITTVESAELTTKLDCPSKTGPGKSLADQISITVENKGTIPAKNFIVQLVLSRNSDIPIEEAVYSAQYSDNVLLEGGKTTIPVLEPGQKLSVPLQGPLTIPPDTTPGAYFLAAVVDPTRIIEESSEDNNRDARFISIDVPAPKKISLQLPETKLIYQPANFGLNIISHNALISDGKDWRKCMIRPFIHQITHAGWQDFFWEIDSTDHSTWIIKGIKFCRKGGNAQEIKLKSEIKGGSKDIPPNSITLFLPDTHLDYEPEGRILRIYSHNNIIIYVPAWKAFQLKPYIIRLQYNSWTDFFWEINTFENTVKKISGINLTEEGGTAELLNIKLTVEKGE